MRLFLPYEMKDLQKMQNFSKRNDRIFWNAHQFEPLKNVREFWNDVKKKNGIFLAILSHPMFKNKKALI